LSKESGAPSNPEQGTPQSIEHSVSGSGSSGTITFLKVNLPDEKTTNIIFDGSLKLRTVIDTICSTRPGLENDHLIVEDMQGHVLSRDSTLQEVNLAEIRLYANGIVPTVPKLVQLPPPPPPSAVASARQSQTNKHSSPTLPSPLVDMSNKEDYPLPQSLPPLKLPCSQ